GAYTVIVRDEHVLLSRWAPDPTQLHYRPGLGPSWTLPGGGLEAGEPPEAAAVREVLEETGYVPAAREPRRRRHQAVAPGPTESRRPRDRGSPTVVSARGGPPSARAAQPRRRARDRAPGRPLARVAGAAGGGLVARGRHRCLRHRPGSARGVLRRLRRGAAAPRRGLGRQRARGLRPAAVRVAPGARRRRRARDAARVPVAVGRARGPAAGHRRRGRRRARVPRGAVGGAGGAGALAPCPHPASTAATFLRSSTSRWYSATRSSSVGRLSTADGCRVEVA